MRRHRTYGQLDLWRDTARLRELAVPERLAAIRVEPVLHQSKPSTVLELLFRDDKRFAVVPLILVHAPMVLEPECEPFIWPESAASVLDEKTAQALSERVMPWFLARCLSRQLNEELVHFIDESARGAFERARALRFVGATPLRDAIDAMVPYVYATRFAFARSVVVDDAAGWSGAALLSRTAGRLFVQASEEDRDFAHSWFGIPFAQPDEGVAADVAIGPAERIERYGAATKITLDGANGMTHAIASVRGVPLDITFSFDPGEGRHGRTFGVKTVERALRTPASGQPPPPIGGSSGRILLGIPAGTLQSRDGDFDSAMELARRLRAEGFTVDVSSDPASVAQGYEFVHVFSLQLPSDAAAFLSAARDARIPSALTADLCDVANRLWWGTGMAPNIFKITADEQNLQNYAELLVRRQLATAEYDPDVRQYPYAEYESRVREALALAGTVFVSGPAEERLIRETFGRTGSIRIVPPYVNTTVPTAPATALVGDGDFVFVHAPIRPRCNQLMIARAAMRVDLPVVFAGRIEDEDYAERIREFSDERVRMLVDPSDGEVAALYRCARVYADCAWIPFGLQRVARAALSGCALVLGSHNYAVELWGPVGIWAVDPASEASIAVGLGDAWAAAKEQPVKISQAQEAVGRQCDPLSSVAMTVSGYADAQALARAG
ncbi:MAG: hypothetical protein JOZ38_04340 [Candidatus Eremiobacteraeota bacterium]|nr:hypothetical protein [Candidatus Eremiobacteraeota bacterium]